MSQQKHLRKTAHLLLSAMAVFLLFHTRHTETWCAESFSSFTTDQTRVNCHPSYHTQSAIVNSTKRVNSAKAWFRSIFRLSVVLVVIIVDIYTNLTSGVKTKCARVHIAKRKTHHQPAAAAAVPDNCHIIDTALTLCLSLFFPISRSSSIRASVLM